MATHPDRTDEQTRKPEENPRTDMNEERIRGGEGEDRGMADDREDELEEDELEEDEDLDEEEDS